MIDYSKISSAIAIYSNCGYVNIDVPWWVSKDAVSITAPPKCLIYEVVALKTELLTKESIASGLVNFGCPVASGEQSFLEIRSKLCDAVAVSEAVGAANRKFMCATPCFRHEKYDKWHLPQFFKVELIEVNPDNPDVSLERMIGEAQFFFSRYGPRPEVVQTEIGYDLFLNGIELGSYGNRIINQGEDNEFRWTYGTGLAEPRFSTVLSEIDPTATSKLIDANYKAQEWPEPEF